MELMTKACVNAPLAGKLFQDAVEFGAVHVKEFSQTDWQLLPSWKELRPLEWRRLRAAVAAQ